MGPFFVDLRLTGDVFSCIVRMMNIRREITNINTYHLLWTLVLTNVILLSLAGIFYVGDFRFFAYPFSHLGAVISQSGADNFLSSSLYTASMVVSGILMFILAIKYFIRETEKNFVLGITCILGFVGFVIAGLSPDDVLPREHVFGTALSFASLWVLATYFLYGSRIRLGRKRYLFVQFTYQLLVIAYGTIFFGNLDQIAPVVQKPAVIALIMALLIGANYYCLDREKCYN